MPPCVKSASSDKPPLTFFPLGENCEGFARKQPSIKNKDEIMKFFRLFIAFALICFALSPPLKAADCPTSCGSNGNTAVGPNALDSVTTGINNTAVGTGALTADTSGAYNAAIGNGALKSNTTGQQNMAVGAEALANNIVGNFNMGIGFRALFMNTGSHNSGVGAAALRNNTTASDNTAIGSTAMRENTTGEQNTAIGAAALFSNIAGNDNTAVGFNALNANNGGANVAVGENALAANTTGAVNTAVGSLALSTNTTGTENTAVGRRALEFLDGGHENTAVGWGAGANYTGTEFKNICIGDGVSGTVGESNTIRIGSNLPSGGMNVSGGPIVQSFTIGSGFTGGGIQYLEFLGQAVSIAPNFSTVNGASHCFIGGIYNQTPTGASHTVVVGNDNRLADATVSSRRFKKDIAPIDKISEGLLALKPVTFHFKNDDTNYPQFGLIAEDVAQVNLDWITRDPQGEIYGVRYDTIPVLLLNEFLKEHRKTEEQGATISALRANDAKQEATIARLEKQIEALTAGLQKVSAQFELSKAAPQTVLNNQ
jgi:trimeric autotransporter adhesin